MIVVAAILVAAACVGASARRLWLAANPTTLHPDDVIAELRASRERVAFERFAEVVSRVDDAEWERELATALSAERADTRIALVNEQLMELDYRTSRWARVPRVCASIATSVGIMLGTLVLRNGLANAPDLATEEGERFVRATVNDAIAVVVFGMIGTSFSIAAHAHARRLTRSRLEAADRMIEKLESPLG